MSKYAIIRDTKRFGPYAGEQLKVLAAKGKIRPDDTICDIATNRSRPASEVKGLFTGDSLHSDPGDRQQATIAQATNEVPPPAPANDLVPPLPPVPPPPSPELVSMQDAQEASTASDPGSTPVESPNVPLINTEPANAKRSRKRRKADPNTANRDWKRFIPVSCVVASFLLFAGIRLLIQRGGWDTVINASDVSLIAVVACPILFILGALLSLMEMLRNKSGAGEAGFALALIGFGFLVVVMVL